MKDIRRIFENKIMAALKSSELGDLQILMIAYRDYMSLHIDALRAGMPLLEDK